MPKNEQEVTEKTEGLISVLSVTSCSNRPSAFQVAFDQISTPKALHTKAQGRRIAAHPGYLFAKNKLRRRCYTPGSRRISPLLRLRLFNTYGVIDSLVDRYPGCAAAPRPWAVV